MAEPADDTALLSALRSALERVARERRCIVYRDLAASVPVPPPHAIHRLTLALETLAREDHAAGRPLLAALAVSRAGAGLPGRGFFELMAAVGRYAGPDSGPEALAWHASEVERVWDHWVGKP